MSLRSWAALSAALASASPAVVSAAESALIDSCGHFQGPFTSTFETGPGCVDSPVQMCTHGTLRGDLAGSYEFTFLTFEPTGDPNTFVYTGRSVVALTTGEEIYGSDTGTFYVDPATGASFTTTVSVIEGTNFYTDASGQFVATGSIPNGSELAEGRYTADLCVLCDPKGGSKDAKLCRKFDGNDVD